MTAKDKKAGKGGHDDFVELSPLEAIHDSIQGFYNAGVADITTLREFDALCLPEVKPFTPPQIKKLRLREHVSQGVFAQYLNMSISTIKQWEIGEKQPRGASLRLLNLVSNKGLEVLL